jgi:ssDNA thymidine ADP-ribosyltransferase, DarT
VALAAKTYIWRMTDYRNIGFILQNGLHCCNCGVQDPNYINIGHKTLITNRGTAALPIEPGGVLNDYVPFYFHYKMPMLWHIYNGWVKDYAGTQNDIIYLVSTAEKIVDLQLPFLFTDRHGYLAHKKIFNSLDDLDKLSFNVIRDDTWLKEYTELKKELKQAEFLVHQHVPVNAILGIIACNENVATFVQNEVAKLGLTLQVVVKPDYYYP